MQRAAMEYNVKPTVSWTRTAETGLPSKHDRNIIECLNHSVCQWNDRHSHLSLRTVSLHMNIGDTSGNDDATAELQVTFDPSFCLSSPLRRLWFLRSFQWCRSQRRLVAQQRCNDLSNLGCFSWLDWNRRIKHALMWSNISGRGFSNSSALKQLKIRATLIPFFSCSTLRAGDSGPSLGNSVAKDAIAMMHGQV